ncbi:MAG: glycosyltransferase, partial [Aquificaceae bacterium]
MKVFVSGGGTGGHFFPALALLECILEKNIESLFVGSKRGIEHKLKEKIPVESLFLPSHPFMGRSIREKFLAVYKNLLSLLELLGKVKKETAGVV